MAAILEIPRTMWDLYKCLPEGVLVQLINNQLIMSPAPKDRHQKLLEKLHRRLGNFVEDNTLGETRVAPSDVFLNEENIYQPDIYFVSNENLSGFQEDGFRGAPDLIIEILSPGSEKYDRNEKMKVYEASGVKEYWLVNPDIKTATGYFNTNGCFELFVEEKEKLSSKLLNTEFIF
jgi:Uma2 family endonuclease